ncbi:MAG: homoserine O-acetyltransferase [Clostridia bacterium]|nr:homoserine O-acetyltransferase [Clostridia bacterium]
MTLPVGPAGFPLEGGDSLPAVTLAYETYGRLNRRGDNAILVLHALTGDAHVNSHGPGDRPGWWEGMVGPGRALDTDRFFVICSNVLGGCQGSTGPACIDPRTGRPYGMRFPVITIRDMVAAQRRLVESLGVRGLVVVGGSMGGMQALQWGLDHPDLVRGVMALATPAFHSPQSIAYGEVERQAILRDPDWRGGDYYGTPGPVRGLALARMIAMITYHSPASMWRKFGRQLQDEGANPYARTTRFRVESYLEYQGDKLVGRFDANSYLYLTRAMDLFDLSRGLGDWDRVWSSFRVPVLVLGISSDILYPEDEQRFIVEGLRRAGRKAVYARLVSPYGHDAFLIEKAAVSRILRRFLVRLTRRPTRRHPALPPGRRRARGAGAGTPTWPVRRRPSSPAGGCSPAHRFAR